MPSIAFILKTSDGGNNWEAINTITQNRALYSIFFLNSENGWATGISNGATGGTLHTSNGGNDWTDYHITGKDIYFLE